MSERPVILVTGGAGFIGSALVRRFVGDGRYDVVNLDKLTYAADRGARITVAAGARHHLIQGDIADATLVRDTFATHRPVGVIHLAAESHVDRSIDGPGEFLRTNVFGTYTLLDESLRYWRGLSEQAQAAFRFLHVSTDEVFGDLGPTGTFSEESPYRPNSPYAATKAGADHLVRAWHRTYGLPTLITNSSNNFGPYQFPEKLIPLMITRALLGQPLPVYGDGGQVRDWLHVEDHVDALLAVFEGGRVGEVYNVGARAERRNIEVVREICRLLDELRPRGDGRGYADLVTPVADRPGHDRRYAIDPTKLEEELDWRPKESFESGLRRTVEWYLANEAWTQEIAKRYQGERLGMGGGA